MCLCAYEGFPGAVHKKWRRGGILTPPVEDMIITSRWHLLGVSLQLYVLTSFILQGGREQYMGIKTLLITTRIIIIIKFNEIPILPPWPFTAF